MSAVEKKPAAKTTAEPAVKKTATKAVEKKPAAKVAAKKPAAKKAVAKKAAAKKPAAKAAAKKAPAKPSKYSSEQVYAMIQQAAYFAAKNDGYTKGPSEYWLQAEAKIKGMIK